MSSAYARTSRDGSTRTIRSGGRLGLGEAPAHARVEQPRHREAHPEVRGVLERDLVRERLGPLQQRQPRLPLPRVEPRDGHRERQLGVARDPRRRIALEDAAQGGDLAVQQQRQPVRRGELRREVPGLRLRRVAQGVAGAPGADVPVGGTTVQARGLPRQLVAQPGGEQLAQQRMAAVPRPVGAVDGGDERVLALELRQPLGRARIARDRRGQVGAHLADHRRPEQERDELRRLAGQHLRHEVVGHREVVAGEGRHERGRVRVVAQRQRGEPEAGGPALRPLPQPPQALGLELRPRRREQRRGLVEREGEVGLPELADRALQPQAADPQRRVDPRGDHHPQVARRVAQQPVEVGDGRRVAELVQVVEHQHDRLAERLERVDERGDGEVEVLGRVERERADRRGRARAAERLEDRAPEAPAVGVRAAPGRATRAARRTCAAPPTRRASRSCPRRRRRRPASAAHRGPPRAPRAGAGGRSSRPGSGEGRTSSRRARLLPDAGGPSEGCGGRTAALSFPYRQGPVNRAPRLTRGE